MRNKKGEGMPTGLILVAILVLAVFYFNSNQGGTQLGGDTSGKDIVPSSGTSTVNFLFQDKLATSNTPVVADYYVFDDTGKLAVTGTATTSGTASESLNFGKKYSVYAFNGTGSTSGYYLGSAEIDNNEPTEKVNLNLYKEGQVTVSLKDPNDLNSAINIGSGQNTVKSFYIQIEENASLAAFEQPVVAIDYNSTAITQISVANAEKVECGSRLTAFNTTGSGTRARACFKTSKDFLTPADSVYQVSGSINFGATAATSADILYVKVLDNAYYKKPDAETKAGFVQALQDDNAADVGQTACGGATACVATLTFDG